MIVDDKKIIDPKQIEKPLKAFALMSSLYTALVITAISLAGKLSYIHLFYMGRVYISTDFFLVPFIFYFQNVITEVYGYERCRRVIHIAVLSLTIFISYTYFATLFPVPKNKPVMSEFNDVIHTYPRHFIAFLFALFFGGITNDYFISKLKIRMKGSFLWFRSISATFIGDFIYQLVGSLISRLGTLHFAAIIPYDLLSYGYKLLFELASVPLVYIGSSYLKKVENLDIYDKGVNYNPFKTTIDNINYD